MDSSGKIDAARLNAALARATNELLAARTPAGHWEGELSSSALSTATAVTALAVVERASENSEFKVQSSNGLAWLVAHQNPDGGWGDTTKSLSNISTTTLCWAAFGAAGAGRCEAVQRAERWLAQKAGGIAPDQLAAAIIARYGKDRTFSVPILTMCALAGRLGEGRAAWRHVIPLPFELAAFPHSWFAALRLPVVSYALPALIAIGQARHHHRPSRNPFARMLRHLTRARTLRKLTRIQPSNGGFLEATPLTSFVTMSLAGSGEVQHPVTQRGVEFLIASQRPDGSWPIDTNLATWVTTLAVNALPSSPLPPLTSHLRTWLLAQQYRTKHPYTHAAPGGWAWTDLPGGVPDADDTAGALIALRRLGPIDAETQGAALAGIQWLLDLQNRDGGIPTFCRGWGALPFDRSSADITAHVLRAWRAWDDQLSPALKERIYQADRKAVRFLLNAQRDDDAWEPLWFGNQHAREELNLVYGTCRVLSAMVLADPESPELMAVVRAVIWLLQSQNEDGGWGKGSDDRSSTEETALAVEALSAVAQAELDTLPTKFHNQELKQLLKELFPALQRGTVWLVAEVESGRWRDPTPIGFYFAKLWYFERLYPLIFTVAALSRAPVEPVSSSASA